MYHSLLELDWYKIMIKKNFEIGKSEENKR